MLDEFALLDGLDVGFGGVFAPDVVVVRVAAVPLDAADHPGPGHPLEVQLVEGGTSVTNAVEHDFGAHGRLATFLCHLGMVC